jgi:exonuclease III
MPGTAFLAREGIQLDHIAASPTGRVMAATFQGVLLLNVYAPSGTTMRAEREKFSTQNYLRI